jgi:hypothetical protein
MTLVDPLTFSWRSLGDPLGQAAKPLKSGLLRLYPMTALTGSAAANMSLTCPVVI